MNTRMDHLGCPLSPRGSRDDLIKELSDPTANFSEAVAKTKVKPTQNSMQSVYCIGSYGSQSVHTCRVRLFDLLFSICCRMRWNQAPKWAYSSPLNINQVKGEKLKCEIATFDQVKCTPSAKQRLCRMPGCQRHLADAGVTLQPATALSHVCQYSDDGAFPDLLATQLLWSWWYFVPEQPPQPIAKISFPLLWGAASCSWRILDPSSVSMKK